MNASQPQASRPAFEIALLALLATLWGAAYTFIKIGVETIPPVTFIAARTALAGGLLWAVMALRGVAMPRDPVLWRRFFIQAILNSAIPFTLIAWAELSVEAGLATILNSTTPVFAFLMTALWFRHEPTSGRKLLGVALGLAGACLIVGVQALDGLGREVVAQVAIIVASACYAGAAIFGKGFKGVDPMAPAAGSLICGAVILAPVSLLMDRPWTIHPSGASLAALLGLSVFSTALAFAIYFRLLHTLGSVSVTSQAFLRVPIGVAIGAVFLGEALSPTIWAGLVCVVAGVAVITVPARPKTRPTSVTQAKGPA
ncbi:DMT family transporter [Microvirga pudoricolor]|uniref:DMT family transporter n=1 Tax=Microvirga pudoricolor TaxID=2778729 RepID=UPI00194F1005|nr:EamA family transporter [Microvirga pudoricolor]MBM6596421.1 EamA family transporter [Microvirga pudoricolor]